MTARQRMGAALSLALQPMLLNVVSVFATAYIIRRLGPRQYGVWAVATSLTAANAFLANLGLRPLFVRSLAQARDCAADLLAEQLSLRILMGAGAGCCALLLCVALRYPSTVLSCVAVCVLSLVVTVTWTVLSDLLQALQRFRATVVANLIAGLVLTAISVLVASTGAGPLWLAVAYMSGPIVNLLLLVRAVRREGIPIRLRWVPSRYRVLLRQSRSVGLQQFVITLRDKVEELLVPKLAGIEPFGFFAAGVMPAARLTYVSDGVASAFFPAIAGTFQSADAADNGADGHVAMMTAASLILTLPCAIAVTFLAPFIAAILFPGASDTCRAVMRLTVWAAPLVALATTMMSGLQASGRHAEAARAAIVATVVGTALSAALVFRYGIIGASWAWVIRAALLVAMLTPRFVARYPGVGRLIPLCRIGLSAALAFALLWWIAPRDSERVLAVCGWLLAAIAIYGVSLVALRVIRPSAIAAAFMAHDKPAIV